MFSVLARHRKHASLFFNLHSHANTKMNLPMLRQDEPKHTQQVGEAEPKMSLCTGDNLENFMAKEHSCDWDHISKIGEECTSTFSSHIAAIITSSHLQLAGRLHPVLADTDLALSFSRFGHLVVLQKTDIPGHEAFNTWETPNSTTC